MTEAYLLFSQAVLPCLTKFNKIIQCEEPLIHKLYNSQQRFMSKLESRFIKPSTSQNHKDIGNSFSTLSSDDQDRRNDVKLAIWIINRSYFTNF